MLSFVNDYSQGAHEAILNRLLQINSEMVPNGTAGQESGVWFLGNIGWRPHCGAFCHQLGYPLSGCGSAAGDSDAGNAKKGINASAQANG